MQDPPYSGSRRRATGHRPSRHPDKPELDPAHLELELRVVVQAEHQIAHARQAALQLAERIGLRRVTAFYVATAVSEMASNLVFHTTSGGEILLRPLSREDRWGIEVEAHDSGPGIADLELAQRDGYSSRGSLGAGLGGMRRLMDGFEIDSAPGQGTRIRAWKWQPQ